MTRSAGTKRKRTARPDLVRDPERELKPSAAWTELAAEYPDEMKDPRHTIYALPRDLVNLIHNEAPKFFGSRRLEFEKVFADLDVTAFFLGQGWRHPRLIDNRRIASQEMSASDRRQVELDRKLNELLIEELRRSRTDEEIAAFNADQAAMASQSAELQLGFLGWLVPDSCFRSDCGEFRKRYSPAIETNGHFPTAPKTIFGEKPRKPPTPEEVVLQSNFQQYFLPWGIERYVQFRGSQLPQRRGILKFRWCGQCKAEHDFWQLWNAREPASSPQLSLAGSIHPLSKFSQAGVAERIERLIP